MKTINIIIKDRLSSIQSVRALLKRNGYKVGSWCANGRISGMSNFFGDIEVKELFVDLSVENIKISEGLWKHIRKEIVGVEINFFNDGNKLIKEIYKLIKENGYKVNIKNNSIEVFEKLTPRSSRE